MVDLIAIGPFPETLHYYMEQECGDCGAKNYITLKPRAVWGVCWSCKASCELPEQVNLPKPEHPLVMN